MQVIRFNYGLMIYFLLFCVHDFSESNHSTCCDNVYGHSQPIMFIPIRRNVNTILRVLSDKFRKNKNTVFLKGKCT